MHPCMYFKGTKRDVQKSTWESYSFCHSLCHWNPNSLGNFVRNHPKSSKITCSKKVPQLLDFDGIGRVANAKHPWLGYTQSWIQQKQPVEFDGFGTHGYMLYSRHYAVEYWIHQNQAKPGGGLGVVFLWENGEIALQSDCFAFILIWIMDHSCEPFLICITLYTFHLFKKKLSQVELFLSMYLVSVML